MFTKSIRSHSKLSTTMGKTTELSKDVGDKIVHIHKTGRSKKLGEKLTSAGVINKKYKTPIDGSQLKLYTRSCNNRMRIIMRKVIYHPKNTWERFVDDLKAVGRRITKNTIGNTLLHYEFKSYSTREFALLKKWHKYRPIARLPENI